MPQKKFEATVKVIIFLLVKSTSIKKKYETNREEFDDGSKLLVFELVRWGVKNVKLKFS